jgi:ParB family transcriptional regulator, chromosome partitioning protein
MATKKRGLGKGLEALLGVAAEDSGSSQQTEKNSEDSRTASEKTASEKTASDKAASGKKAGTSGTAGTTGTKSAQQGAQAGTDAADRSDAEMMVKISLVVPNKDQPRKNFDKDALEELTESIRQYGIVTPLIVRKSGHMYEIIAGERRWRAAQAAGLKEIPVVVRDYDERLAAEVAIIENLQREDLNPIEEAQAYEQLMNEYGLSQEEVAARVSKNRTTITNTLRLLKLDPRVREMVVDGSISAGHARALLGLTNGDEQKALADIAAAESLSVREIEKRVKNFGKEKPPKKVISQEDAIYFKEYEDKMQSLLGTKVHINRKSNAKGRIEIDYYSQDELERLMELIERTSE